MTALKNSYLLLVAGIFLLSCNNKANNSKSAEGYLQSAAYQKDLDNRKDYKYSSNYSTRRMFMLLGEEGFLYSSEYDLYAVYFYVEKNVSDFYILKSKDSIVYSAYKRLNDSKSFFYVDKANGSETDKDVFKIEVTSKIVGNDLLPSIVKSIKKVTSLAAAERKYFPEYHSPVRGLYLFDGKEYYLITDYNLEASAMNGVDFFFRKSLFEQE
jgi:hypothetical protein